MQTYDNKNEIRDNVLARSVAHVVYAETMANSLRVVEALTSMIQNRAQKTNQSISDVISDANVFESLNKNSQRSKYLNTDETSNKFQMCLRVATRMLHGNLDDMCRHATIFHRDTVLPDWAIARGYILETDGILFYL